MNRLARLMTLLLLLGGCSADAVSEPDPTLETPGAFFAVLDNGSYVLYRTLAVLASGSQDETLFVARYAVTPSSVQDARELAQDPTLPTRDTIAIGRRYVTVREWSVVWFRSVSSEEAQAFR